MATYDEILGNSPSGDTPPKGSKEWHEQQQDGSSAPPPAKGTQEWAEQKAATAPVATGPKPDTANTPPPPTKQEGSEGGSLSYTELFKKLNPYTPPTDEELAKEKRKQKRDQIFAAIGDGISALSNLYFTTRGAPNMYSGKDTASERLQVRYDRLMKERKENARAYVSGLFGAMQADDVKARDERNWRHQLGRERRADGIADAKEKRDKQMFDLNVKLQNNKISAAEAEAERKRVEAEYADDLAKAKVDTEKAKASASRASASASNARAGYYNRGGSNGNKKRMTLTIDGKTTYYDTKEDYERAVQREAKRLGIPTHQYVRTTETQGRKSGNKNVSTPKPISQLAGEVEIASNEKKKTGLGLGNGENKSNGKKTGLGL